MSEAMLTVEDAAANLGELVERVHTSGEAAILVKEGRVLARIVPVLSPSQNSEDLIGFLRRWRAEYPEADYQLGESIDLSRQAIRPPHDPWA